MGDRAMAEIKVEKGSLFFYTHWAGRELPKMAEQALAAAKPRIGDDAYALRIVVDSLIKSSGALAWLSRGYNTLLRDEETGAGLMLDAYAEDSYNNDTPSVTIDLVNNKVLTHGRHAKT